MRLHRSGLHYTTIPYEQKFELAKMDAPKILPWAGGREPFSSLRVLPRRGQLGGNPGIQPGRDRRVPQVVGRLASSDADSLGVKVTARALWKILR